MTPLIAASDEPTRDELQQIVAEQTGDIEELRQKKDRYRQKYLDEKQRIATIKDNHRLETNRLTTDLAAARRAVNVSSSAVMLFVFIQSDMVL